MSEPFLDMNDFETLSEIALYQSISHVYRYVVLCALSVLPIILCEKVSVDKCLCGARAGARRCIFYTFCFQNVKTKIDNDTDPLRQ